ncbi:MAG: hypothetical protein GX308_00365 [Epulopiscium sp.]|nr:hypothetical protein [Candidatus Epulonipiscium sp.]
MFLLIVLLIFIFYREYRGYREYESINVISNEGSWNREIPFIVYQNNKYLKAFSSFSEASNYAGKNESAYIYYYDGKTKKQIWSNAAKIKESTVLNVPMVSQMPELARGCEVTSLAMMLQFAGIKIDKMTLAKEIKKDNTPYEKKNGKIYYGHPNVGFVGDIYTFENKGYGVYHKPIKVLAEEYLPGQIIDLTGCNWKDLLYFVSQETPVWVISNGSFKELGADYFQEWNTPQGIIHITMKEHSVLITGYDKDYVYINNPLKDKPNQKVPMKDFYASWKQMGKQAVTYIK